MTTPFNSTRPPDSGVIYKRHDPHDLRLGDSVAIDPLDYAQSEIVILGCPQDDGVVRNKGRVGAKDAPDAIRTMFYKLVNFEPSISLFDLGNTIIQPTLEETHAVHQRTVEKIILDGKTLVMLGGGNDVAYPDCAGLAQVTTKVLAFNIDAHFDVRADEIRNSGTPYRQLLNEGHLTPDYFFELGYLPMVNSGAYRRFLTERGVDNYSLQELRQAGIDGTIQRLLTSRAEADAVFWGLDMDVVNVSYAPGVSAPNVLGLNAEEFCQIAFMAGLEPRTRLLEISEVNPTFDVDGRTARLAAMAIYHFLMGMQARHL